MRRKATQCLLWLGHYSLHSHKVFCLADTCWLRALAIKSLLTNGVVRVMNVHRIGACHVGLQPPSFCKNKGRPSLFYHVLDTTNVDWMGESSGSQMKEYIWTHVLHPEQQAIKVSASWTFKLIFEWKLYPQVCSFSQAPFPYWGRYFHMIKCSKAFPPLFLHTVNRLWENLGTRLALAQIWSGYFDIMLAHMMSHKRAYWFGCQAVGRGTGWVGSEPKLVGIIQTTGVDYPSAMKKVHMHKQTLIGL